MKIPNRIMYGRVFFPYRNLHTNCMMEHQFFEQKSKRQNKSHLYFFRLFFIRLIYFVKTTIYAKLLMKTFEWRLQWKSRTLANIHLSMPHIRKSRFYIHIIFIMYVKQPFVVICVFLMFDENAQDL